MAWIKEMLLLLRQYRQAGKDFRASMRALGYSNREIRKIERDLG